MTMGTAPCAQDKISDLSSDHALHETPRSLIGRADSLIIYGDFEGGRMYYERAMIEISPDDHSYLWFDLRTKIGNYYIKVHQYDSAIDVLKKNVTSITESIGAENVQLADALEHLAQAYRFTDRAFEALEIHFRARNIRFSLTDSVHLNIAYSDYLIGNIYLHVFYDLYNAEKYTFEGIKIHEVLGIKDIHLGKMYYNYAAALNYKGSFDEALVFAKKALQVFETLPTPDVRLINTTTVLIAEIYIEKEETGLAIRHLRQAIRQREQTRGIKDSYLGFYYNHLAAAFNRSGNPMEAIKAGQRAIWVNDDLIDFDTKHWLSDSYLNLGESFHALGKSDTADYYFRKSLETRLELFGKFHSKTAQIYNRMGEHKRQLGHFDEALENYHKAAISFIPSIADLGMYDLPADSLLTADLGLLEALQLKADVFAKKFESTSQIHFLKKSLEFSLAGIQVFESITFEDKIEGSQLFLIRKYSAVKEKAIQFSYRLYRETNERTYADHFVKLLGISKANLFHHHLQERTHLKRSGLNDLLKRKVEIVMQIRAYKDLLHDRQQADSVLFELNKQLKHTQLEIEKASEGLTKHNHSTAPDIEQIQGVMKPDEGLVDMYYGKEAVFILFITSADFRMIKVDQSDSLRLAIEEYGRFFQSDSLFSDVASVLKFSKDGYRIYKELLGPGLEDLGLSMSRLVIIPDGPLAWLPFESLVTELPAADAVNYNKLAYLTRKHPISYMYSMAQYVAARSHEERVTPEVLGFSYSESPVMDEPTLSERMLSVFRSNRQELPGAAREVDHLAQLFSGAYFFGDQAHKMNLRRHIGEYDILHMAMHAQTQRDTDNGYLVMKNQDNDEELLYSYEVESLSDGPRIVFLSACGTGIGKQLIGEGVRSLASAFLRIGTSSVISSLWEIDDRQSSKIVQSFYSHLSAGQTVGNSLQQAKLAYLSNADESLSNPRFWAALVVYGDAEVRMSHLGIIKYVLVVLATMLIAIGVAAKVRSNRKPV